MTITQVTFLLCVLCQALGDLGDQVQFPDATLAVPESTVAVSSGSITSHQLIAQTANSFTFKTYDAMKEHDGNICVSPFSLEVLLAMVYLGSTGAVSNEIQAALHLPENTHIIKEGFKELIDRIETSEKLQIAAKMFAAIKFRIKNTFISDVQTYFNSGIDSLDFMNNSEEAVTAINSFVAQKTHEKITSLFDTLPRNTALVLVNALYFKANWKHKFHISATEKFFVTKEDSVDVDMMSITKNFTYKHDTVLGAQILEMPYEGDYSMIIVLPDEKDGLHDVENKMALSNFETITAGLHGVLVRVKLPTFKIEKQIDLKTVLQKMGIRTMFEPYTTDLSGISDDSLYVSEAIQKTYINVDKKGTEAAAATGFKFIPRMLKVTSTSQRVKFIADHPFLFMIAYKPENTIFFKGRFSKPN